MGAKISLELSQTEILRYFFINVVVAAENFRKLSSHNVEIYVKDLQIPFNTYFVYTYLIQADSSKTVFHLKPVSFQC